MICQDTCDICRPIQCHRLRSGDGRTSLGRRKTRTSHSNSSAANDHQDGCSNRGFRDVRSDSLKRNRTVMYTALANHSLTDHRLYAQEIAIHQPLSYPRYGRWTYSNHNGKVPAVDSDQPRTIVLTA